MKEIRTKARNENKLYGMMNFYPSNDSRYWETIEWKKKKQTWNVSKIFLYHGHLRVQFSLDFLSL
ncbi:hypothetical protein T02_13578 [Trichinella nativa]|uniref:Uncharacterized protein n=1 Tax=Trichinella nativa TaxID=6335 RepID=A0A0V1KXE1_9BILA|nr:hypothetical protein T02_13578 [Trichinella nativa]